VIAQPVTPLPSHQLLVFLLQVGVLLTLALILGRAAGRLGMPAVAGELCAGALLGPTVFGRVVPDASAWLLPTVSGQFHLLDALGLIGVVLLVGVTGIEVDLGLVRERGATALSVGLAGLVVPFATGVAVGHLLPGSLIPGGTSRWVFALFLGVALCVSALPVIAKTLSDMNLLHRNIGQLTLAAGIVDDVLGWLLLSVVSAMAVNEVHADSVVVPLLYLAAIVIAALTVGRVLVRQAMRMAGRAREPGPTVATAAVIILLCAAATQAMELEAVFGAFIGGILIGSCGAADLARLAPLRAVVMSVLAPLFFATAGLRIDLGALAQPAVLGAAVAVLAVAVIGKFAGAFLGALATPLNRWETLALGAGMNARGVIQIVVASAGLRLGVLTTDTYTIVILVAIATSLMAPPLLSFAMRRVEQTSEEEARLRDRAAFGEIAR
jgi:K+:H+ antiporter